MKEIALLIIFVLGSAYLMPWKVRLFCSGYNKTTLKKIIVLHCAVGHHLLKEILN